MTITHLIDLMEQKLAGTTHEAYGYTHMKMRLQEHFGERIAQTEVNGKPNVVTLRSTARVVQGGPTARVVLVNSQGGPWGILQQTAEAGIKHYYHRFCEKMASKSSHVKPQTLYHQHQEQQSTTACVYIWKSKNGRDVQMDFIWLTEGSRSVIGVFAASDITSSYPWTSASGHQMQLQGWLQYHEMHVQEAQHWVYSSLW